MISAELSLRCSCGEDIQPQYVFGKYVIGHKAVIDKAILAFEIDLEEDWRSEAVVGNTKSDALREYYLNGPPRCPRQETEGSQP